MKYIIFEDGGGEKAVLFPDSMIHASTAHKLNLRKILSAGFIRLNAGMLECHGRSVSLHKRARPQDSEIVQNSMDRGA